MKNPQENDPYRENRIALLRYYNSQCTRHAGYFVSLFVALVVALSTILLSWEKFITIPTELVISVFFIISVLGFGCFYAIMGSLYWGYYAFYHFP